MGFGQELKASFAQAWRNPSLYGVALTEFVIVFLLSVLFALIDTHIMGALSVGALDGSAGLGGGALAALVVLVVVQAIVILLIDGFFKAGLYGMMKNLFQDGSTTIREFFPNARRYWGRITFLQFVRYAMLLLLALPLVVTIGILEPQSGIAAPLAALALLLVGGTIALLFLLYVEAIVVFEDGWPVDAIRRSVRLARSNAVTTILVGIIALALVVAVGFLEFLVALPIEQQVPTQGLVVARDGIGLASDLIMLAVMVVIALFVFHAYRGITGARPAAKPVKKRKR